MLESCQLILELHSLYKVHELEQSRASQVHVTNSSVDITTVKQSGQFAFQGQAHWVIADSW